MYAVIQTGGKQYRVEQGETLRVEKLLGDAGTKFKFDVEPVNTRLAFGLPGTAAFCRSRISHV